MIDRVVKMWIEIFLNCPWIKDYVGFYAVYQNKVDTQVVTSYQIKNTTIYRLVVEKLLAYFHANS